MASGDARLAVIDEMIDDSDEAVCRLGLEALDAMLETGHVSSSFQPDFRTRNQHREWRWRTEEQRSSWFEGAYRRLEALAADDRRTSQRARSIVAGNARANAAAGIGLRAVQAMRMVRPSGYWDEGWRTVNEVLHFDRGGLPDDLRIAFETLENDLRPRLLEHSFEAFVLGEPWRHWHAGGSDRRHTRDVRLLARSCGVALAQSGISLAPWLRHATGAQQAQGPIAFGRGLVSRTDDLNSLWTLAVASFRALAPNARGPALLSGIIDSAWLRDPVWTEARLIEIAADLELAEYGVALSPRDAFDAAAIDRLIAGLGGGTIPPVRVGGLMYGGVSANIAVSDLARLLDRLIDHAEGAVSALNILFMRRLSDAQDKRPPAPELDRIARQLLLDSRLYDSDGHRVDYELGELARSLFPDAGLASGIIRVMLAAANEQRWNAGDLLELKKLLVTTHLEVVLDELVACAVDDHILDGLFDQRFSDDSNLGNSPTLDESTILAWIERDPQARALKLAELVPYAITTNGGNSLSWSSLALAIVSAADDPVAVLTTFAERFYSGVSTGPFYLRYERRLPLIDTLMNDRDPAVRNWARDTRKRLEHVIAHWQKREREEDSRFE